MVPKDKVTRLRMKLAESNLPKGGGVGYEIFDKSDALGTTSFVQNINHLRALEGELSRTIRAIDRIQAARVHLVLPERPLFSRETPEPSASIVVRVRGSLEPQQIRAIRHVVASAVNGLKPQRVSIVDEAGRLLADGAGKDSRHRRRRRAPHRLREADAQRGRGDRVLGGRPGPRPRPAHRRLRLQQGHPDLGQVRSRRPRAALQPDPRGIRGYRRQQRPGHGQQRTARQPGQHHRACGPRPEQEERRDQQLRDFPHHQDRSHRGRTGQPDLGRGAGRRRLYQERKRRDGLSGPQQGTARPHRHAGALGDRLRPEARRPGRGGQPPLCRSADAFRRSWSRPACSACCSSPRTTSCTSSNSAS